MEILKEVKKIINKNNDKIFIKDLLKKEISFREFYKKSLSS